MTAVVGVVDSHGDVYMGADAAGVSGWEMNTRTNEKVFRNGEYLIGTAGSTRIGNVLQYSFAPPPSNVARTDKELFGFMVTGFIDGLRGALKEAGVASKDKEVESGGLLLVGVRGRLFRIDYDYQIGESIRPYSAIGVGAPYAFGAMYALSQNPPGNPLTWLYTALEAAEEHSCGVRGPFHFETTAENGGFLTYGEIVQGDPR